MFEKTITDKIRLELIGLHHADALYELIDSNREHLRPWLAWVDRTTSVGSLNEFIISARVRYQESGDITTVILYENNPAGCISLEDIEKTHLTSEIGYWLGKKFEGMGLITRSATVLLERSFNELHLNRVQLRIAPNNERSKAVARRLGFTYEGTLRQVARMYDQFEDLEYYSMLKEEWESRGTIALRR